MYNAPGIGLAAPQVGVGLRLMIVDLMPDNAPKPLTLINPRSWPSATSGPRGRKGACRCPTNMPRCRRPARVTVRFHDLAGAQQQVEADGLLAACLQHELDHLDGVLFVDHLSALKRNMLLRRLAKELKQKAAG